MGVIHCMGNQIIIGSVPNQLLNHQHMIMCSSQTDNFDKFHFFFFFNLGILNNRISKQIKWHSIILVGRSTWSTFLIQCYSEGAQGILPNCQWEKACPTHPFAYLSHFLKQIRSKVSCFIHLPKDNIYWDCLAYTLLDGQKEKEQKYYWELPQALGLRNILRMILFFTAPRSHLSNLSSQNNQNTSTITYTMKKKTWAYKVSSNMQRLGHVSHNRT